jgi:hypothetical protein
MSGGWRQRFSKDFRWVEMCCPAKHTIAVPANDPNRNLERFLRVHGGH